MQNQQIITRLDRVEQELKEIKKLVKKNSPPYGSDAWWEAEISAGEKQIKKGQYKGYKNAPSMIADLLTSK